VRSAFKGKQVIVPGPKDPAAAQEGLFGKLTYASDPYVDASKPGGGAEKERKLGFYTRAGAGRDDTASTIGMGRHREHIKREFKHIDEKLAAAAGDEGAGGLGASSGSAGSPGRGAAAGTLAMSSTRVHPKIESEGRDVKADMPRHLYDYVHSDLTRPDWQKTSRDVWYHMKLRPSSERPRYGPMVTSSEAYGYGASEGLAPPEHGKRSAYKDFYNKGHVDSVMPGPGAS